MKNRILFICHGNICRSPMAEFVMKDMVAKQNLSHCIEAASAATSYEEIGNPPHMGTWRILHAHGISCKGKTARRATLQDYADYDYLVCMDSWNIHKLSFIIPDDPEGKISKLLEFCGESGDVDDPWYTGDFETTWEEVNRGCAALLSKIKKEMNLP